MAAKSVYLSHALLRAVLQGFDFAEPTQIYVALYTGNPGAGDNGTEVQIGVAGYERQAAVFGTPGSQVTINIQRVQWPPAEANWGTIVAVGLRDAPTGGNLLYYSTLNTPVTVNSGFVFILDSGDLVVAEI